MKQKAFKNMSFLLTKTTNVKANPYKTAKTRKNASFTSEQKIPYRKPISLAQSLLRNFEFLFFFVQIEPVKTSRWLKKAY